jgi:hypothetical protein
MSSSMELAIRRVKSILQKNKRRGPARGVVYLVQRRQSLFATTASAFR